MTQMKIKNLNWQDKWNVLCEIFDSDFKGFLTLNEINKLSTIGFTYMQVGKHPKMYFYFKGEKHCITLSSSPSSMCAGRNTLRYIRRIIDGNDNQQ